MPSDTAVESGVDRGGLALDALVSRVDAFHTAVATAEEEIRSYVATQRGASEFKGEQALVELGPFAVGRIDPDRFAILCTDADELAPEASEVLDRAEATLARFARSTDLHRVSVEPGGDLRDAVKQALAVVGEVFGAARAVELARSGVFDPSEHGHLLGPLPFRLWNRAERQLAPPLVVEVRGEDCLTSGLGEFLEGSVAIVLVVRGLATPAPLARLITPGTFVLQTADPTELGRLAESPHPGVAILFDEERSEQARFVHDPDAGDAPWARLAIRHLPERPDVGRGRLAPAWLEEIAHLESLTVRPSPSLPSPDVAAAEDGKVARGAPDGPAGIEPADQLAAWLLSQTDLGDA